MRCPACNLDNPASARRCVQCGFQFQVSTMHGRYTILRALDRGGMGTIHLAEETIANHSRKVVIKEMLDYFDAGNPQSKARAHKRFEAEAATLAALNIPGIPQIFDYFNEGGRYFIVMQFIEGRNLESGLTHEDEAGNIVNGRAYPVEQVRSWGAKVCKILELLEKQGVYHLDIKPANLIIDPAGEVWLVDFGTAKAGMKWFASGQPGKRLSSIYGTIGYAAPEQKAGKPHARSDVYALAATLYHLLTDDDPRDLPYHFPKLTQLPLDLTRILKRALATDPVLRIDAGEFSRLLENRPGNANPFHWRDGSISREPTALAQIADQKWGEALEYFKGGEWERWFKDWHRNDLVVQLQAQKTAYGDGDQGLDAFLRVLQSDFPEPKLHLPLTSLDVGVLPWNSQHEMDLEVMNRGSGCLQAKIVNTPPGLKLEPGEIITHESLNVKIHVNSRALTPGKLPQTLTFTIDAGSGGQGNLSIKILVPEPDLELSDWSLDFGVLERGAVVTKTLEVKNRGKSPCWVELTSGIDWLSFHPDRFSCPSGSVQNIEVSVDTQNMRFARRRAALKLLARAGGWRQSEIIQVGVSVSALHTLVKELGRPISWVTGMAVFGALFGGGLSFLIGDQVGWAADAISSAMNGVLWGAIICVLSGLLIAYMKGFDDFNAKRGVRRGFFSGLFTGVLSGLLAGFLSYYLLVWLGLDISLGQGVYAFGALTGGIAGGVYGGVLWLLFFD